MNMTFNLGTPGLGYVQGESTHRATKLSKWNTNTSQADHSAMACGEVSMGGSTVDKVEKGEKAIKEVTLESSLKGEDEEIEQKALENIINNENDKKSVKSIIFSKHYGAKLAKSANQNTRPYR